MTGYDPGGSLLGLQSTLFLKENKGPMHIFSSDQINRATIYTLAFNPFLQPHLEKF